MIDLVALVVGGEASLQGQSTLTGRSFVPSVRARSVIHVESGMKLLVSHLPSCLCPGEQEHFPFPFRICQLEPV